MSQVSSDFLTKLEAIKTEYARDSLPAQIADVQAQCNALPENCPEEELNQQASALHAAAHKLTGSSGTFGFIEISAVSREICNLTESSRIDVKPFNSEDRAETIELVDHLQQLFQTTIAQIIETNPASTTEQGGGQEHPSTNRGTVVVLCETSSNTRTFADKFIAQEFDVIQIEHVSDLYQAVMDNRAEVVVADLALDDVNVSGAHEFLRLNSIIDYDVSVIFISVRTDMIARLAAVRAGGDAFIIAPFEENEVMDTIDRLIDTGLSAPYRVLIVDQDVDFIRVASLAIEEAGMICEVVTDPINTLDALASFVPESILMDISMPGCTGQELASVILQQETFVGTPVIFMSEERRHEGRIDVVRQGSYGYLAKPVNVEMLVGTIRGQATRFRTLRSRMVKDSLTGLNNQSMTRRLLEREIDNARRTKLPLSFAMIDIDHFKDVNDTYGHSTGDQVLRSLSRLLKQRFRSNDVVGRLGGEEFGVVIAGTTGTTSKVICDQVREAFSEFQYKVGEKTFSCTFSVGIAEFPYCQTSLEIMEVADKALYEAKHAGRNQVILSAHNPQHS